MGICLLIGLLVIADDSRTENVPPLTPEQIEQIHERLDGQIATLTAQIEQRPDEVALFSARGSARFQRGQFAAALDDFDQMVVLRPELAAGHWRRGIALYYAGRPGDGVAQFEGYHTVDSVDRENGLWRFLCQARVEGLEAAQAACWEYTQPDRPPMPELYDIYADKLDADTLLPGIAKQNLPNEERQRRLFYADLYLGLLYGAKGDAELERRHIERAVANRWGRSASGGPGYMWQVARVHWELLEQQAAQSAPPLPEPEPEPEAAPEPEPE